MTLITVVSGQTDHLTLRERAREHTHRHARALIHREQRLGRKCKPVLTVITVDNISSPYSIAYTVAITTQWTRLDWLRNTSRQALLHSINKVPTRSQPRANNSSLQILCISQNTYKQDNINANVYTGSILNRLDYLLLQFEIRTA